MRSSRRGHILSILLFVLPPILLAAIIVFKLPPFAGLTGGNTATGRYIRAADGTDLFFRPPRPHVREEPVLLIIRDLEGDEHAYDGLSTGDLIRIGYELIEYDEEGIGRTAPYEWELREEGTLEDIPADVYAEIQTRFPGQDNT